MILKLLHIADLHLGRSFRNLPEAQETLSEARYETLQNCIDKANEVSADIFVIAGDLFDRTSMNVGNIDANRRKNSQSHHQFGEEYQTIVLTCHPDHAEELGGEDIMIG